MRDNKVLLLGVTSGIGFETCKILLAQGNQILATGRNSDKLETVKHDLENMYPKGSIKFEVCDFKNPRHYNDICDSAVRLLGDVNLLLIFPGVLYDDTLEDANLSDLFRINLLTPILLMKSMGDFMARKGNGQIGVISSISSDLARASNYTYGASKSALDFFCNGYRSELSKNGVRLVVFKPGFTDTEMTKNLEKNFLFSSPQKVATGICKGLRSQKDQIYLPGFWKYITFVLRHIPRATRRKFF